MSTRRVVFSIVFAGLTFVSSVDGLRAQSLVAVEYYYAAWDHYFVTASQEEIAVLDGGAFGGVWKRTGETFSAWSQGTGGALPTCRFFSTAFNPRSSHFYTPYAKECSDLQAGSTWQFENIAFYVRLPDVSGNCPAGTKILYRLYNNGSGGAPNHRYTTSPAVFNTMLTAGWTMEGDGRTNAFACVPLDAAQRNTAEGAWAGRSNRNQLIFGFILDTGATYFFYTAPGTYNISGVIQGTFNSANGYFSSMDAKDFAVNIGVFNVAASGTYVPKTTIGGSLVEPGNSVTFAGSYDASYDQPASLADAAGTYSGNVASSLGWQSVTFAISPSGSLTGSAQGCTFSGTATPHGAVNVFDVAVRFNGGFCQFGTSTLYGFAHYDADTRVIQGAAPNASRSDGIMLFGGKK